MSQSLQALREYIVKHGLKGSRQREIIAQVFFSSDGHLRVDELLERVRESEPRISQATVYRTMKLLTDCGLAGPRNFSDGHTRYEPTLGADQHHDHLICTRCGSIVEFVNARIEELQEQVAVEHGFKVGHHRMEIYGVCAACQST